MKVTWEVRGKFRYIPAFTIKVRKYRIVINPWITTDIYSGVDHQACYNSALKVMNERSKGFGRLFNWELRGS